MRHLSPPPPVSDEKLAAWLRENVEFSQRGQPLHNGKVRVRRTIRGTYEIPRRESDAVSSPAPGVVFRGEWRPDIDDYVEGNLVVVRGGISAGSYIALRDVPAGTAPAYPDVGIYWVSIARNFAGAWA